MKNTFLTIGLLVLSACGNVTTSKSFTPAQRLKNTENELSKMGVTFDVNNALTSCESIYKATCENRVILFKDFIIETLADFGSFENMPVQYQQRTTNVTNCNDTLTKDLNDSTSANCHH